MKSIKYRSGYEYQLSEDYTSCVPIFPVEHVDTDFIVLSVSGDLIIRRGYAWDGPSGPAFDTKNFMRGSLVHDALYQLMREGMLGREWKYRADRLLQSICIEDGMSPIRAWWVYHGVATFGTSSTLAKNEPAILTAP